MSKINENPLVQGARGNFGKHFVYKKRGSNTHIARMPVINKNAVATTSQELVRDRFSAASLYAQGAVSSPDLKKEYAKKAPDGNTAFNMAMKDYLKPPVVKAIDVAKYNGEPGSIIVISARDDFRVASVTVGIRTANGVLLEEGNATLNPIDRNKWNYQVTQSNAALAGTTITATAFDLPGNTGVLELTL